MVEILYYVLWGKGGCCTKTTTPSPSPSPSPLPLPLPFPLSLPWQLTFASTKQDAARKWEMGNVTLETTKWSFLPEIEMDLKKKSSVILIEFQFVSQAGSNRIGNVQSGTENCEIIEKLKYEKNFFAGFSKLTFFFHYFAISFVHEQISLLFNCLHIFHL